MISSAVCSTDLARASGQIVFSNWIVLADLETWSFAFERGRHIIIVQGTRQDDLASSRRRVASAGEGFDSITRLGRTTSKSKSETGCVLFHRDAAARVPSRHQARTMRCSVGISRLARSIAIKLTFSKASTARPRVYLPLVFCRTSNEAEA